MSPALQGPIFYHLDVYYPSIDIRVFILLEEQALKTENFRRPYGVLAFLLRKLPGKRK